MRRRRVILFVFLLLFGFLALLQIMGKPRFETYHKSDVVQLVGAGFCFGVGFGVMFGKRRFAGD
jgi:hypothetical protein